ncbi:hypothetical protein CABS01_15613 [Colletotrichum abscissum]|uniref:uncharacterized protein n=1 Tax=Colletotrichum abscissum TaxID=1671311 RepID=UPI0027D51F51|nr:uncharacterized protein CABS01_15613 [Colletotrichum abscissum]KAK1475027.1 hypothetical protein CABS01_15613 [Colletotrichum abscissum]
MGGNRREIRNRRSKVAFGGRVCLFLSLKRNSPSWPRIAAVTRRGFSGQRLVPSYLTVAVGGGVDAWQRCGSKPRLKLPSSLVFAIPALPYLSNSKFAVS